MTIARTLGAALATAVLLPGTAAAADKPAPCDNLPVITDAANDARIGFAGSYTPVAAEANQEITGFFWRQDPRGSSRVLTANLVVKDLNQTVAPGSLGQAYRFFYTTDDGVDRFAEYSFNTVFGESFSKGYFDTAQGGLVSEGTIPGRTFPGPDGVIQLEIASGKTGVLKFLDEVRWNASTDRGLVIAQSDEVAIGSWDGSASCDAPAPAGAAKRSAAGKRVVKAAKRRR